MSPQIIDDQDDFYLAKLFKLIFRNIWIIISCTILAMGIAYAYNRYSIPIYKVSAKILIKEDANNRRSNETSRFIDSDLLSTNQNLQNELMIIKSYPIVEQMVKNLDLRITYYEYRDFQYYNAYKAIPFKVILYNEHPQLIGTTFDLVFDSNKSFELKIAKQDGTIYKYNTDQKVGEVTDMELNVNGNVGEIIKTENFKFMVVIDEENEVFSQKNKHYAFKLSTILSQTRNFENSMELMVEDQLGTVIQINLLTSNIKLGEDGINELIRVYSETSLAKKNHLADMTIQYIDDQINEISTSLNLTGIDLQNFMSKNKIMDVGEQSNRLSVLRINLQNQLAGLLTQKKYYSYATEYNSNNNGETQIIAPSSMGVNDPILNKLIDEFSNLQSQKVNLIKNKQERNPMVDRLNIQIKNLQNAISENIISANNTNELAIGDLQHRIAQIEKEMSKLPETQLQMGGYARTYKLNDAIYNYLLEKQAEAKITKASNMPDNVIIEPAKMVGFSPVSPKKLRNYMIALFMGFALPVGILLLKIVLNTTITTQNELEKITDIPIIGKVLHHNNRNENNVFSFAPEGNTAETFRTLRTNLNFRLGNNHPKTILVTSCLSGEGKTFNAINIAASYAQTGKKTILLDFDLRKKHSIFKSAENTKGMSSYLLEEASIQDVIQNTELKYFDFINSGPVLANPIEFMEKENMEVLFRFLKNNYDYIIIDTPPLAQVSDALTVIHHANLNLIVTRYKITKKRILKLLLNELNSKKITNICLILNDNKLLDEQMGYGYYKMK